MGAYDITKGNERFPVPKGADDAVPKNEENSFGHNYWSHGLVHPRIAYGLSRVIRQFYADSTMVRYGVIALGASAEWLVRTLSHLDTKRRCKYLPISGLTVWSDGLPEAVQQLLRQHFRACLGDVSDDSQWLVVDVIGDTGNTMKNAISVLQLEYPGVTFVKGLFRNAPILDDDVVDLLTRTHSAGGSEIAGVEPVRRGLLQSEFKRLNVRMFKKIDAKTMVERGAMIPVELDQAGVTACGGLVAQIIQQYRDDKYDEAQDAVYMGRLQEVKDRIEQEAIDSIPNEAIENIEDAMRNARLSQSSSCEFGSREEGRNSWSSESE